MTQGTKAPERVTVIVEGAHGGVYIGHKGESCRFADEYARLDLLTAAEARAVKFEKAWLECEGLRSDAEAERDAEKARADALAEKLERAVEALTFYGSHENWVSKEPYVEAVIDCDEGSMARDTLSALEEKKNGR